MAKNVPPSGGFLTVGPDLSLPPSVLEKLIQDLPPDTPADLNQLGEGRFIILEHDADSSGLPDGTFIVRLPEGFTP